VRSADIGSFGPGYESRERAHTAFVAASRLHQFRQVVSSQKKKTIVWSKTVTTTIKVRILMNEKPKSIFEGFTFVFCILVICQKLQKEVSYILDNLANERANLAYMPNRT